MKRFGIHFLLTHLPARDVTFSFAFAIYIHSSHARQFATIDRSIDRDDDATHRGCHIASVDAMRVVGATNDDDDDDDANVRGSDDEATTEGG